MTFLCIRNVGKRYGAVSALDGIDLDVTAGTRTAVVGPSGSGKSTLLRLIAGFDFPDTGSIAIDGETVADESAGVPVHRRAVGVVTQDGALFPHLSIRDNIGFGLDRRAPDREQVIRGLMDMVDLQAGMLDRRPHELSGGQQQRVALARALARRPRVMLLDEPFSALDPGLREAMRKATAEVLRATGITSILVTHDQAEALSFAEQIAVLRDGRLAEAGSPADLYWRPRRRDTALFLGDAILLPATLQDGLAHCVLGRLSIDARLPGIEATIMLRPEQISLTQVPSHEAAEGPGGYGQVAQVEFGGAACLVTLSLVESVRGTVRSERAITVRSAGIGLPPVGSYVRITVSGPVHVLK